MNASSSPPLSERRRTKDPGCLFNAAWAAECSTITRPISAAKTFARALEKVGQKCACFLPSVRSAICEYVARRRRLRCVNTLLRQRRRRRAGRQRKWPKTLLFCHKRCCSWWLVGLTPLPTAAGSPSRLLTKQGTWFPAILLQRHLIA
jgi:hypothetical protein